MRNKEARQKMLKFAEQSQGLQDLTTQMVYIVSPLSSYFVVPILTLSGRGNPLMFDPNQFGEVEDIKIPLVAFILIVYIGESLREHQRK